MPELTFSTTIAPFGPEAAILLTTTGGVLRSDDAARAAFDALSYTRRNEIARSIAEAKRPETRERRLVKALEELRA